MDLATTLTGFVALYIFMLAAFTGYEIIGRVPAILHTPLMSGSNFVHGIVVVGAMYALLNASSNTERAIGALGVTAVVTTLVTHEIASLGEIAIAIAIGGAVAFFIARPLPQHPLPHQAGGVAGHPLLGVLADVGAPQGPGEDRDLVDRARHSICDR